MTTDKSSEYPLLEILSGDVNYIRQETGKRIREAREQLGMSQGELSEILSRRQAYISELETGKTEPNATMLVQLAYVLKKPVAFFFPPNFREFGIPDDKKKSRYSIEEKELIANIRKLGGFFNQQMAIHLVNALVDYDEHMLTAFDDDIPTEEDIAYRKYLQDMEEMERNHREEAEDAFPAMNEVYDEEDDNE